MAMNGDECEAAFLIEVQRMEIIIGGDQPEPLAACFSRLCWLLSISVPKKSAKDGSTGSFSLQFMHQQVRKGFLYNFLLPDF